MAQCWPDLDVETAIAARLARLTCIVWILYFLSINSEWTELGSVPECLAEVVEFGVYGEFIVDPILNIVNGELVSDTDNDIFL